MSNHATEKDRGWVIPHYDDRALTPGLYLVATPIGNLRDVSIRALDVLAKVDAVLCEDTRVSGKLLTHYGLHKPLIVYNDHSDDKRRREILKRVTEGQALALISDAGTPLIADPGYKLVAQMQEAGLMVSAVPGANAPLTALQLSGLPSDKFCFLGFLPAKSGARREVLAEWQNVPATLIAFETAPRLQKTLADIQTIMGARQVVVARELTKLYEEARRGTADELLVVYEEQGLPKGEIVLVIAPPEPQDYTPEKLRELLKSALETMSTRDAAAAVASQTGKPRKQLYEMVLELVRDER